MPTQAMPWENDPEVPAPWENDPELPRYLSMDPNAGMDGMPRAHPEAMIGPNPSPQPYPEQDPWAALREELFGSPDRAEARAAGIGLQPTKAEMLRTGLQGAAFIPATGMARLGTAVGGRAVGRALAAHPRMVQGALGAMGGAVRSNGDWVEALKGASLGALLGAPFGGRRAAAAGAARAASSAAAQAGPGIASRVATATQAARQWAVEHPRTVRTAATVAGASIGGRHGDVMDALIGAALGAAAGGRGPGGRIATEAAEVAAPRAAAAAPRVAAEVAEAAAPRLAADAGFEVVRQHAALMAFAKRIAQANPKVGEKIWILLDDAGRPLRRLTPEQASAAARGGAQTTFVRNLWR